MNHTEATTKSVLVNGGDAHIIIHQPATDAKPTTDLELGIRESQSSVITIRQVLIGVFFKVET